MATTLDVGVFTPAELTTLLTAAKAEYLARISGKITQGSSAAQSYGLTTMSVEDLISLLNSLGTQLGIGGFETRVSPDFNRKGGFRDPTLGW